MDLPEKLPETIALDLETKDPGLTTRGPGWAFSQRGGNVAGAAIAYDGAQFYLPFGHEAGGNLDPEPVVRWLRHILSDPQRIVALANANYDIGWLRWLGVEVKAQVHDVLVQCALLDEHRRSYSLDEIAKDYLGIGKDTAALLEAGRKYGLKTHKQVMANLWKFHADEVREYAEQDAKVTLELWKVFQPMIEKENLEQVYNLERDLLPLLLDMRWRGVRVDLDRAEQVVEELKREETLALEEIKRLTGLSMTSTDPKTAGPVLRSIGVDVPKTPKSGQDSVTKEFLEELPGEVPELIRTAREARKAWSDFVQKSILEHHHKGRIHAEFLSVKGENGGTVGGRFSSKNPNLQQIPARNPKLGPKIRGLYLPEPGERWGSLDYSSQEPRLTVHYAVVKGARRGQVVANQYIDDPRTDYHQLVADLCKIERKPAKIINLGLAYGMGGASLCHSLGLPTELKELPNGKVVEVPGPQGAAILEQYHASVPYIRELSKMATRSAKLHGFVRTVMGRKCRFPMRNGERWFTHKALNRVIQGSAADQMKKAMVDMYHEGILPLITVHDEVCLSAPWDEDFKRPAEIMANTLHLELPFVVDIATGDNWGEALD